ncbi:MAG TPA: PQQ-dependent sugar dehydrogenase [Phycisphaerales bacterium]|nr:PQQ-dependent sugar dehydrogenase [Phycisphaerales bacterium]
MRGMRTLAAVGLGLCACADPCAAQRVDELWTANCASCHGARGAGGAGVGTLLEGPAVGRSERETFDAIGGGKRAGGDHDFSATLNDEQLWGVTVHLRELQAQARREREGSPAPDDAGVYRAQRHAFRVETVLGEGLRTPWSVDFLPDGRKLVTNRPGTLQVETEGGRLLEVRGTPRVRSRGQGGLMDVAPHPSFAENGWIYLAFSDKLEANDRSPGMTKIVRGRISRGEWTDEQTVFEADHDDYLPSDIHFGCRLVFQESDGAGPGSATHYLYFPIGERGFAEHAQDLTRPNGKVHRLWDTGGVPADNPFVERARADAGVYESIWSYGHRNPQGLAMEAEGVLWDTEHGPRGGDEVNVVERGRNYGWPLVSFGINYDGDPLTTPFPDVSAPGEEIAMPSAIWLPSVGACGLDVVRGGVEGEAFPGWRGDLIAGGLSGANVDRFRFEADASSPGERRLVEREELLHGMGRVRDVVCGPDGSIYVVLNDPDRVVRLVPAE